MSAALLGISPLIAPCIVHGTHQPRAWINELHHVILESWTIALGLPQSRKVALCPTGHVNLHAAVRDRIAGRPYEFFVNAGLRELVDEAMAFYTDHAGQLAARGITGLEVLA